MKRKMVLGLLLLVIALVALGYICFYHAKNIFPAATQQNLENQVCFGLRCFSVELATTDAEREKGLMSRPQMDKDKGMLFVFDKEGIYPFWMKNTLIPLDMVWVNSAGKVVFIAQNVQPCKTLICPTTLPAQTAKYVLEVNAGICQQIGLKAGDIMKINIK